MIIDNLLVVIVLMKYNFCYLIIVIEINSVFDLLIYGFFIGNNERVFVGFNINCE